MQDLDQTKLSTVTGGATTANQQITTQLQTLQTNLQNALNTNNNGSSNNTMMLLCMMMAMRPQAPAVVAGGPPVVAAAAPGPVVNIHTRVRRF